MTAPSVGEEIGEVGGAETLDSEIQRHPKYGSSNLLTRSSRSGRSLRLLLEPECQLDRTDDIHIPIQRSGAVAGQPRAICEWSAIHRAAAESDGSPTRRRQVPTSGQRNRADRNSAGDRCKAAESALGGVTAGAERPRS